MTPEQKRKKDRAAWVMSIMGIAELSGAKLADVAAHVGLPPYATPGDGEVKHIADLCTRLDAARAEAEAEGFDDEEEDDEIDDDPTADGDP